MRSTRNLSHSASASGAATPPLLTLPSPFLNQRTRGHGNQISCVTSVGSQDEAVREAFPWILFDWSLGPFSLGLGHETVTSFFPKPIFQNSCWSQSRGPIEIWNIKNTLLVAFVRVCADPPLSTSCVFHRCAWSGRHWHTDMIQRPETSYEPAPSDIPVSPHRAQTSPSRPKDQ